MTVIRSVAGVRRVSAALTRDRLNGILGDVRIIDIAADLEMNIVAVSNIKNGYTNMIPRDLAAKIRDYAKTYRPPVDEAVEYMATDEGRDFVELCRSMTRPGVAI